MFKCDLPLSIAGITYCEHNRLIVALERVRMDISARERGESSEAIFKKSCDAFCNAKYGVLYCIIVLSHSKPINGT